MIDQEKPSGTSGGLDNRAELMRASVERELDEAPFHLETVPPRVPDHVLLQRIGRGAYGEVWLARNALGTLRAVKVVYRGSFKDERPYRREFNGIVRYEPISRTHPALVAVLHVGMNDTAGCFYYVMELADDAGLSGMPGLPAPGVDPCHARARAEPPNYIPRTLRSELSLRQRLLPGEAAHLGVRLAGGLAHLHAHGLVHRDVKPSNVIFVSGEPKLADIGLVTGLGDSISFVGTEGFVPPEGPGTTQADLYALGKLLYEAVTGRDRMDFPQLPEEAGNAAEMEGLLELNEVVTRACLPKPQERYTQASEMEADLNLILAGRSLRAAHRAEQHLQWLKRFVAAACLGLLLAACGLWAVKKQARQARQRELKAAGRAQREAGLRQRAEAAEAEAKTQLWTALLEQARATVRSGELGQRLRALDALRRAGAISNSVSLRGEALAALTLPDLRFVRRLPSVARSRLQLDPAFQRIAACRNDGALEIRSAADLHLVDVLSGSVSNRPADYPLWSPEGQFLAGKWLQDDLDETRELEVWDTRAEREVLLLTNVPYGAIAFHPQKPEALISAPNDTVSVWNLKSGLESRGLKVKGEAAFLAYSPSGDRFAVACRNTNAWTVSVYDAQEGKPLFTREFPDRIGCLAWDPNDRWLGVADYSGAVRLMEARSGIAIELGRHKVQAVFTEFSRDGRYLLSGGWERELICWDVYARRRAFDIHLDAFVAGFGADGESCAIQSTSGLLLYRFEEPKAARELDEDLGGRIKEAAFSADGRWLAASGQTGLAVWDLKSEAPAALAPEGGDSRVFFSPDKAEVFAGRDDGFRSWRVGEGATRTQPPVLEGHLSLTRKEFSSFCLLSNRVVFTSEKGSAISDPEQLDRADLDWKTSLKGVNGTSPDGCWLGIFSPYTPWLHIYELPSLRPVVVLTNLANVWHFRFLPKSSQVVVCTRSGTEFWSTKTWKRTRVTREFIGLLPAAEESRFWLTRDFRNAGLYDAATLAPVLPLPPGVLPLALSPGGDLLAVSVEARRVQVWDLREVRKELREIGLDWD